MTNIREESQQFWGLGATIGLSLLVLMAFIATQTVVFFIYVGSKFSDHPLVDQDDFAQSFISNGDAISASQIPAAIIGILVTFAFIMLHKRQTVENYLYLHAVPLRTTLKYFGMILVTLVLTALTAMITDHPTPEVMVEIYQSAKHPALLWFAVIIAAPFFEEILFRGFLFEGLRHSPVGIIGTAMITSVLWASIHLQYGLYEIVIIFLIGLLLSYAKVKTGSLYIPIMMHIVMNLAASIELTFF